MWQGLILHKRSEVLDTTRHNMWPMLKYSGIIYFNANKQAVRVGGEKRWNKKQEQKSGEGGMTFPPIPNVGPVHISFIEDFLNITC